MTRKLRQEKLGEVLRMLMRTEQDLARATNRTMSLHYMIRELLHFEELDQSPRKEQSSANRRISLE